MSQPAPRRYLFCEYESLAQLDFERLEEVCERLFILISSDVQAVPFGLVRLLQQLGPAVKWIVVDQRPGVSLGHHLTFLLGRLHQKLPAEIQFAVLSEDEAFDPLIQFINEKGRSALRVRREKTCPELVSGKTEPTASVEPFETAPEAEKIELDEAEITALERARQLWLENDLLPASAESEKN